LQVTGQAQQFSKQPPTVLIRGMVLDLLGEGCHGSSQISGSEEFRTIHCSHVL
jgi:hypothetical protein